MFSYQGGLWPPALKNNRAKDRVLCGDEGTLSAFSHSCHMGAYDIPHASLFIGLPPFFGFVGGQTKNQAPWLFCTASNRAELLITNRDEKYVKGPYIAWFEGEHFWKMAECSAFTIVDA